MVFSKFYRKFFKERIEEEEEEKELVLFASKLNHYRSTTRKNIFYLCCINIMVQQQKIYSNPYNLGNTETKPLYVLKN